MRVLVFTCSSSRIFCSMFDELVCCSTPLHSSTITSNTVIVAHVQISNLQAPPNIALLFRNERWLLAQLRCSRPHYTSLMYIHAQFDCFSIPLKVNNNTEIQNIYYILKLAVG